MTDPTDLLAHFIAANINADHNERATKLRAAVNVGFGTWMSPEDATTALRPATHLHEISVFGISATGETARAAVANWFTVAIRLRTPEVAA